MQDTSLVKHQETGIMMHSQESLNVMLQEAQTYIDSGLLPAHIKTPQAALMIMQYGRELSIGPVQSLNNIYVVSGRPSLSGNLMAALIRAGGVKWQTVEDFVQVKDADGKVVDYKTTIKFIRDGLEELISYTWSDAKKAQLTSKDNWQKYPRNMLYWRCFSMGARRVAPDLCMGMYLASEISDTTHGAEIIADNEDGTVTVLSENK